VLVVTLVGAKAPEQTIEEVKTPAASSQATLRLRRTRWGPHCLSEYVAIRLPFFALEFDLREVIAPFFLRND
jgi:hypothetical protein